MGRYDRKITLVESGDSTEMTDPVTPEHNPTMTTNKETVFDVLPAMRELDQVLQDALNSFDNGSYSVHEDGQNDDATCASAPSFIRGSRVSGGKAAGHALRPNIILSPRRARHSPLGNKQNQNQKQHHAELQGDRQHEHYHHNQSPNAVWKQGPFVRIPQEKDPHNAELDLYAHAKANLRKVSSSPSIRELIETTEVRRPKPITPLPPPRDGRSGTHGLSYSERRKQRGLFVAPDRPRLGRLDPDDESVTSSLGLDSVVHGSMTRGLPSSSARPGQRTLHKPMPTLQAHQSQTKLSKPPLIPRLASVAAELEAIHGVCNGQAGGYDHEDEPTEQITTEDDLQQNTSWDYLNTDGSRITAFSVASQDAEDKVPQLLPVPSPRRIPALPPTPPFSSAADEEPSPNQLAKYKKMLRLGIPVGAVKISMKQDGVDPSLLNAETSSSTETTRTKPPAQVETPKDTHRRFRLHWEAHKQARANTVWAMAKRDPDVDNVIVDDEEFQSLFCAELASTKPSPKPTRSLDDGAVKVIDPKRANNGGIILARIKLSYREIARAIDTL